MPTSIVRIATGEFEPSGGVPDGVVLTRVTVTRNPDADRERWDGSKIVSKPQSVIDAQEATVALAALRVTRNALLAASDWTQIPDTPLTDAEIASWGVYRQALRDLPATTSNPAHPVWPQKKV